MHAGSRLAFMPRIPDTPIGLVIRESRFAAISTGAIGVAAAISELRASYERLREGGATSPVRETSSRCFDELAPLVETLVERIAILRGVSTAEAQNIVKSASADTTADAADGSDVASLLGQLSALERHLRKLIERSRIDPPTEHLYVTVLAAIERQQWQVELDRAASAD